MNEHIGDKIKSCRKAAGLTQEELGAKVGVTKATINKYETGIVVNLRRPVIEKLAAALDVEPGYLVGWTDKAVRVDTVHDNHGLIGQNSGTLSFNESGRALTKEELAILRIYNELDVSKRMELVATALRLEKENKE